MSQAAPERDVNHIRDVGPVARRTLTVVMVLAAIAYVALTIGTSLIGRTAFYGGGNLVDNKPWTADGYPSISVSNDFVGDTIDYFIPGRSQIVDRVRHGDLPGWNSLQGAGDELASAPSYGLLAPTAVAWWLLPHSLAPGWEKLTVLALATAGTALFLRRLNVQRHAAWLGGMVYAGTGFMIAWTNWPQADVAAMLPWLLWATERALQLRSWRAQIPVALSVAALLLGGFPAVTGLAVYATAGYVLLRFLTRPAAAGERLRAAVGDAVRLAAGAVTGVLLAGVQLVVFAYSYMDLDTSYRANAFFRVVPLRMALTALFPNVWGTHGGPPFYTRTNPIEANAYFGAAAVVLVVVALLLRPRPGIPRGVRSYFVGVVLVGVVLIYVQPSFLDWVGRLPIFSGNAIGRLISVVLLAGAVLAGLGFDALLAGTFAASRGATLRVSGALLVTVAAVAGVAFWTHRQVVGRLQPDTDPVMFLAGGIVAVLALAVLLACVRPSWRGALLAVVPVLVVVQGVAAATPMWAQVDRAEFYPTTPAHRFLLTHLGDDRMAVTGSPMVNGSTAYYGLRSATGHVFTTPQFTDLQKAVCASCRLSATYWVLPGATDLDIWESPVLDRMGVRYLTADPESEIPGIVQQVTTGDADVAVPAGSQQPMSVPIPGGPLRGIMLEFRSGPAALSRGDLVVEVRDAHDNTLLSTRRLIQFPRPGLPLYVPLAGEGLSPGGQLTLTIRYDGDTAAPVVAGSSDGLPTLRVIRPAADGLRMAYAGDVEIWERTSALPRIRWAGRSEVITSPPAQVTALSSGTVPDDTVVLGSPGAATDGRPGGVQVQEDDGDVVRARVDAQGAGYLVLADSVQTDWTATVDGQQVPIVAADHAFGAVHVPQGRHEVEFDYTPRGATAGLVMTGVGIVALVLMALPPAWWRRLRRRNRRHPGGEDDRTRTSADEDDHLVRTTLDPTT